ncbi:uncharacterized protein L203_103449 [Cryptococcus depauperatus CBS 7841]|uniref:DNA repair protein REV1 n=1 Tax=Cryptococcus depauperatus CBS 7841 TaxID=1295531 RepID=A0A1E3IIC2_9TREE|nr:DNA repair protein REV1 [Cryptococcus depauperatus CBS 7841]
MSAEQKIHSGQSPEPPSSFPFSSPSFWAEAAIIPIPSPPPKRPRSTSVDSHESKDNGRYVTSCKRAKDNSSSPQHGLTFLPNPGDVDNDDRNSYLANPEYAPNRFGDIGDYMRKKEIKVQAQNANIAAASASASFPQLFTGLSFYINGNTHPPMEQLRKLILQRGGTLYPVLRGKTMVDYIVAPVLTLKKHEEFKNHKVIKEGWIVESCEQAKLLDWRKWRLRPEGGWEEGSRKGFEEFFDKKTTTASTTVTGLITDPTREAGETSKPPKNTTGYGTMTDSTSLKSRKTQSCSTSQHHRRSCISISPGLPSPSDVSPFKSSRNVQNSEGTYEHYYKKESNKHTAKAFQSVTWRAQNTAERGDAGGFIDGYYQNSRLHHLSMWKAELKVLVQDAQKRSEDAMAAIVHPRASKHGKGGARSLADSVLPSLPLVAIPSSLSERVIFHVDFDAFFVSCGLASRPYLKGKPVVVCHSSGKGSGSTSEIASCSYEARANGVRNGMSLGRAKELVGPDLVTMPYEFETYKKKSLAFYTVLMSYADDLQAVSVDEALIDVTAQATARARLPSETESGLSSKKKRDPALELAENIRNDVRRVTEGCEVSIGIAHNVLLAKLATRHAKPAGIYHLLPGDSASFLAPLDVKSFPSVGYSTKAKIEAAFKTTIVGELLGVSKIRWRRLLGQKTGDMLWRYLRGIDPRGLEGDKMRKSVSAEMNYGIRFQTQEETEQYIASLAVEVSKRMKGVGVKGRMITLKLMKRHSDAPIEPPKFLGHGWCEIYTRSSSLTSSRGDATDDPVVLADEAVKLLKTLKIDPVELRGVGIQVTKLDNENQDKERQRDIGQGTLDFVKQAPDAVNTRAPVLPLHPFQREEELDDIDPEFLAALPSFLASEVGRNHVTKKDQHNVSKPQSQYANLHSSPSLDQDMVSSPPSSPSVKVVSPGSSRPPNRQRTLSPVKPASKGTRKSEAAHIVRQLRPKGKMQLKAGQIAEGPLFGAWAKVREKSIDPHTNNHRGESAIVDLTEDSPKDKNNRESEEKTNTKRDKVEIAPGYTLQQLEQFNIDPSVFAALPSDVQKEVISQEERNVKRRQALFQPGDRTRSRAVSASVSPVKPVRQGSRVQPLQSIRARAVKIIIPPKPALMKATSLPDIFSTIELWIDSRKDRPPAERDATKVMNYLKRCMNEAQSKVGDELDRAVEVLRWMRIILQEKWCDEATTDEKKSEAGKEWWKVWHEMVNELNAMSVNYFGAALRI